MDINNFLRLVKTYLFFFMLSTIVQLVIQGLYWNVINHSYFGDFDFWIGIFQVHIFFAITPLPILATFLIKKKYKLSILINIGIIILSILIVRWGLNQYFEYKELKMYTDFYKEHVSIVEEIQPKIGSFNDSNTNMFIYSYDENESQSKTMLSLPLKEQWVIVYKRLGEVSQKDYVNIYNMLPKINDKYVIGIYSNKSSGMAAIYYENGVPSRCEFYPGNREEKILQYCDEKGLHNWVIELTPNNKQLEGIPEGYQFNPYLTELSRVGANITYTFEKNEGKIEYGEVVNVLNWLKGTSPGNYYTDINVEFVGKKSGEQIKLHFDDYSKVLRLNSCNASESVCGSLSKVIEINIQQ